MPALTHSDTEGRNLQFSHQLVKLRSAVEPDRDIAGLGEELAAARDAYGEVKQLDETLFKKDYESL